MEGKVFLSHSSKDREIVNSFMENILIGGLNIHIQKIFNTSGLGTGIKLGLDWRNEIINGLRQADLYILFLSENYKKSEICLNEMGAAWVSGKHILPVIIPPISYGDVGIISSVQVEDLSLELGLDRIKDYIVEVLKIEPSTLRSDRWTFKKGLFLNDLKHGINSKLDNVSQYLNDQLGLVSKLKSPKIEVSKVNYLL